LALLFLRQDSHPADLTPGGGLFRIERELALKEMGYGQVYNLGAFKDCAEGGGTVDKPGPASSLLL
jgi:hypothetical protein